MTDENDGVQPPSPPPPPPPKRRRSTRGAAAAANLTAAAAAAAPASEVPAASPVAEVDTSPAVSTDASTVTATAEVTSFTQQLAVSESQEEEGEGTAAAAVAVASAVAVAATAVKKKRASKVKAPPEYDVNDYAPQALVSRKWVGAHVSAAGGPQFAVYNASTIGARAFAMDTRSKRKWTSPPLKEEDAAAFRAALDQHGYSADQVLPHGSYLMNLGSPNAEVHEKSRACLLAELERCGALGLHLYNFHPGSTCGLISKEECMDKIAAALNEAHAKTKHLNGGRGVVTVLECMAGQGGVVGCTFGELKYMIERVDDKSRVGVCIDTCHAFAAGIDLRTAADIKAMLADFDATIGLAYLRGLHFNDSKGGLNCRKDRHENIGEGCIGPAGFRALMASDALDRLPIILETPCSDLKQARAKYANEIAALYALEPGALAETRPGRPLPFHQPSADEIDEQKQLKKEKAVQRKKNKLQHDEDEEEEEAEGEAAEEDEFEEESKPSRQKSKATKSQLKRSVSASAAVVAAAGVAANGDDSKVKKPPLKRHKSAKARV